MTDVQHANLAVGKGCQVLLTPPRERSALSWCCCATGVSPEARHSDRLFPAREDVWALWEGKVRPSFSLLKLEGRGADGETAASSTPRPRAARSTAARRSSGRSSAPRTPSCPASPSPSSLVCLFPRTCTQRELTRSRSTKTRRERPPCVRPRPLGSASIIPLTRNSRSLLRTARVRDGHAHAAQGPPWRRLALVPSPAPRARPAARVCASLSLSLFRSSFFHG